MYKYAFTKVRPFAFKVLKHIVTNYANNKKKKDKWAILRRKSCYKLNFKPWKDPSKGINKQEIWHTHPDILELLVLKGMKLVAFL